MGKLLTMEEAAAELGISAKTLRGHVKDGQITYIAIGRGVKKPRRMFDVCDIEAFKERRRRTDPCPSTNQRARRSTTSTSSGQVVGFMALRDQLRAGRRKPSSG
ncbi:helix-turn-helix domain-containing protein [Xanthobacter autotrophicus]|uniref:helix-turn-helix domain-containing protein n=1 Tax=Xanthobacter autotrophicus TaxID=280 RepID=UPI0037271052